MIKVIDNFIPKVFQDQLEKQLLELDFAWSYLPHTSPPGVFGTFADKNCFDTSQFVHRFLADGQPVSNYYPLVYPFLYFMAAHGYESLKFWRCKSNMTLPIAVPEGTHTYPHTDLDDEKVKGISMVYYANDSDGDTIFFEESSKEFNGTLTERQRVSPKKGTAVLFDSSIIHAGQVPKSSKNRLVVNSIFLAQET